MGQYYGCPMSTPDFPAWGGEFQRHFHKLRAASEESLHQLCRDAVRQAISLCASRGLPLPADDSGPYCVARAKLPVARLAEIFGHLVRAAQDLLVERDLRLGKKVPVLDGTCVTTPDTRKNQKAFPQASSHKPGCGFPVVTIPAGFCLATGMITQWVTGHWYQHELSLLPKMLEGLSVGDVLLAAW